MGYNVEGNTGQLLFQVTKIQMVCSLLTTQASVVMRWLGAKKATMRAAAMVTDFIMKKEKCKTVNTLCESVISV